MAENKAVTAFFSHHTPAAAPHKAVCCLVVDAEEDFDWLHPVHGTEHDTSCMLRAAELGELAAPFGAKPTWLLTYPVLQNKRVVGLLAQELAEERCEVGVQLHPWVTPPFAPGLDSQSFAGCLPAEAEERKLLVLIERFTACFGTAPTMFRCGRYGLSRATAGLLERHGFRIDTSVAPRTDFSDEGGPDFSAFECTPFWFGAERRLLEVPLCRSVVGWGGAWGRACYRRSGTGLGKRLHARALLSRLGCAERITLSPEGNTVPDMLRLVRHLLAAGQRVFSLSLHSSSLAPGRNPYVRTEADLRQMHARLTGVMAGLAALGLEFIPLSAVTARVEHA